MRTLVFLISFLLATGTMFAQMGINADNSAPDPSSMLDVKSFSKGVLMPRMTQGQIGAISSPANGLQVFCTTDNKWYVYVSTVNAWKEIAYGTGTIAVTFICGSSITVNHEAGPVAPVTKTTTYGTVTNIPGETSKCWITSNLGSDHQATAVNDVTEASAGWYWQFNRKQGYKHDGTTRTPNTTWISGISETSDWITANDPCSIELGNPWHLPTFTEWFNVDNTGGWTTWNGPWGSGLKLHAAGNLLGGNGALYYRGSNGYYWSSTQSDATNSVNLAFGSGYSGGYNQNKAYGVSVRCVRDTCTMASNAPTSGTHAPSKTQIIWNWNTVPGATGYKWSAVNNYAGATDMGTATTKTEPGLTCNTAYARYAWAYSPCGNSTALTLNQTTAACGTCGPSITINHVAGVVAPVTKTVTYGTVTNIPGETSKCWITSNLGSDHQATAVNDATEASAGWYWKFNQKQGYRYTNFPTPAWTAEYISESSDWIASNDPCNIELGTTWRVPTSVEWFNVDYFGGWTNWNGPWGSDLKLHAAGWVYWSSGVLNYRGIYGYYWSSSQSSDISGWIHYLGSSNSNQDSYQKGFGLSVRCVRND